MPIATYGGHILKPGTEIEIEQTGLHFRIRKILTSSFVIEWLVEDSDLNGEIDTIPFSLLTVGDMKVELMSDDNDPNRSFLLKKMREG